ncbi:MAG: glycine--tRNA ligase subunit beta [Acidobacteria bacterium]|nr:glycine--tRNA ligase subunit beta [Acidobacteriota bacterium]
MSRTFLLEVGCEEIPARMIPDALRQLEEGMRAELARARVPAEEVRALGSLRRLAVLARELPERQPDEEVLVIGPAVAAAFDSQGRPTRAATGFAAAQGVGVEDLARIPRSRGEHVAVRRRVPGRETAEILAEVVPRLLASLRFPKTMRWGERPERFVRPVRWIVALLGSRPLDLGWAGVRAEPHTRGHRRRGSPRLGIPAAEAYPDRLREAGVLVDPAERRAELERQLRSAVEENGERLVEDRELVETVVHLVERPLVIRGSFDPGFLRLPEEVLRTSLRHHQKCFSVRSRDGRLSNTFVAVADAETDPDGTIRKGNEWVLRARLADARFFWTEDVKRPLAERCEGLERVIFHKDLGSYRDKVDRLLVLCEEMGRDFPVRPAELREACRLAKCDLTTRLVGEFPELQGVLGGVYAAAAGLPAAVCEAIYDQYLPRGLEDPSPRQLEGAVLGIADRIDTLTGLFLAGEIPSGSRDPFGLRRAAQGIFKILVDKEMRFSLGRWTGRSLELHRLGAGRDRSEIAAALLQFLRERLAFVLAARGLAADTVEAVLRATADDPVDALRRGTALQAIRTDPEFEAVAVGFKRVRNILHGQAPAPLDPAGLREPAERGLLDRFLRARERIDAGLGRGDYGEVLREAAGMRGAIDRFFAEVLVMAEAEEVRRNRIGLLQGLAGLFLRIADFSCMEIRDRSGPGGIGG